VEGIHLDLWVRRTAYLLIGTSYVVGFAAGNALETSLAMWLLTVIMRKLVLDGPGHSPVALGLFGFLAVLARPDALLALGCMGLAGLWVERALSVRRRLSWVWGVLAGGAFSALFGLIFFGSVLPNTYTAKAQPLRQSIGAGLHYLHVIDQLHSGGSGLLGNALLVLWVAFFALGVYAVATRFPRGWFLVAAVLGQFLFILKSGGDWMPGQRFEAPVIIGFLVVAVLGLEYLNGISARTARSWVVKTVVLLAAVVLLASSAIPLASLGSSTAVWQLRGVDNRSLLLDGGTKYSTLWAELPGSLRCVPGGALVATTEIGYLGYSRLDLSLLDLRGLTDTSIARTAMPDTKSKDGVADPNWYKPGSPVGRVLVRQRPLVIATFDQVVGNVILGGAYQLTLTREFGTKRVSYFQPTGSRLPCVTRSGST
jgi:hypothetical protein